MDAADSPGDDAHRQAFRSGQSQVSVLSATQIMLRNVKNDCKIL